MNMVRIPTIAAKKKYALLMTIDGLQDFGVEAGDSLAAESAGEFLVTAGRGGSTISPVLSRGGSATFSALSG